MPGQRKCHTSPNAKAPLLNGVSAYTCTSCGSLMTDLGRVRKREGEIRRLTSVRYYHVLASCTRRHVCFVYRNR